MQTPRTRRYIAVLEGEGPGTSRPILATADPETVARVIQLLQERISIGIPALGAPIPTANAGGER